jgi:membrane fusion protein (multidrug efflux system)
MLPAALPRADLPAPSVLHERSFDGYDARAQQRSATAPTMVLASVAFGVSALVSTGCAGKSEAAEDRAPAGGATAIPALAVEVASARRESVADEITATGRIEALQAISLRPDVDGRIVRILAREGQRVARGAPLFQIDDADLRTQVARATADRDLARQTLARTRALLADNASATADLERADAAARSAQATVDQLALRLARTTVRAPFAGVAGQRLVSLGDYVTTQTPLLSLQTTDPQAVVFPVAERYAASLRRGQLVTFRIAADSSARLEATVDFVDPVVALPGRTILVKALARNPGGRLQPGMFVEARLATARRENAVVLREDAVVPGRAGNAVFVVVGGKAVRRPVTLGVRSRGDVEVTTGVSAGEQVVVAGLDLLQDGAPVRATPVAAAGGAVTAAAVTPARAAAVRASRAEP